MSELTAEQIHQANRRSWNAATIAHNSHKANQALFFQNGGSTLFPEEIAILGDLTDKKIVHLQCNSGQDTLSIAKLGAKVTGVDISDEAIEFARLLSQESGIAAKFCCLDVYDWFKIARETAEQFDIAFCSYGAICWLSDLESWAKGIAKVLAPGGTLAIMEFHPVAMTLNEECKLEYPYFGNGTPIRWNDGITDYVGNSGPALAPSGFKEGVTNFINPNPSFEFQWHLGALFSAIIEAGLRIEHFQEYPYFNAVKLYDGMQEKEHRRMYLPDNLPDLPLMYSLTASKLN